METSNVSNSLPKSKTVKTKTKNTDFARPSLYFPKATMDIVKKLAKREKRNFSNMCICLIEEALASRAGDKLSS